MVETSILEQCFKTWLGQARQPAQLVTRKLRWVESIPDPSFHKPKQPAYSGY